MAKPHRFRRGISCGCRAGRLLKNEFAPDALLSKEPLSSADAEPHLRDLVRVVVGRCVLQCQAYRVQVAAKGRSGSARASRAGDRALASTNFFRNRDQKDCFGEGAETSSPRDESVRLADTRGRVRSPQKI